MNRPRLRSIHTIRCSAILTSSVIAAEDAKGVKFLRMENNTAVYAVGSGNYRFKSTLP